MDLAQITVRVLFGWCFTLALLRVSGKRTIKRGDLMSFVMAVVLGDLFDDLFWAEVPASEFVIAAGTLLLFHTLISVDAFERGRRSWRRQIRTPEAV